MGKVDENFDKIDKRFDKVENNITTLQEDLTVLKADVTILKVDVKDLKTDVKGLKSDVSELKGRMGNVETELHRQGLMAEQRDIKLDTMAEVLISMNARMEAWQDHDKKIENHEHRLSAVEHFVRKHPD